MLHEYDAVADKSSVMAGRARWPELSFGFDRAALSARSRRRGGGTPPGKLIRTGTMCLFSAKAEAISTRTAGRSSNFEYLMGLNYLSGRTHDDPKQYPVFPWVLRE